MNRLAATFERLRASDELGLFPYLTTGFPSPTSCAELLDAIAAAGADGIELGVPFSDPLADGATLQRVGNLALEQGASIEMALDLLRGFRRRWQIPVVLMTYYNPILAYGPRALARDGAAVGLDGLIVPDLPLEEAAELQEVCREAGLQLVAMLAPTSTDARLQQTARVASGFIYCVALVGITGARSQLSEELPEFLRRVRAACPQPLVVGFGISRPEHVRAIRGLADGAIVASALADLIEQTPAGERLAAVAAYLRELKKATRPTAVQAAPANRPTVPLPTALELPTFQGPLDLLLALIERRRLEITEISLAIVADQYLQAVRALPEPDPELLAEFLVIGTRLLVLKSRALLPAAVQDEEEESVDDLTRRLEEYRRFKQAALALGERIEAGAQAYPHPPRAELRDIQPPLAPIRAELLARLWRAMERRRPTEPLEESPVERRVRVADRLAYLRGLIAARAELRWEALAGDTVDELIATFLAILELIRRSELRVHQESAFGPLRLEPLNCPTIARDGEAAGGEAE